jgi:hypothetical protein
MYSCLNLQPSFELKPEVPYSPSFVKMASRHPQQHLQLVEVLVELSQPSLPSQRNSVLQDSFLAPSLGITTQPLR